MKPLRADNLESFNRRFNYAKDAMLNSLDVIDATTISLRLSVQDEGRGFDWIDIVVEVSGVSDARLVDDNRLSLIDMSDGLSVIFEDGVVIVAVGSYKRVDSAVNAPLFIKGSTLKYQENSFSA